MNEAYSEIQSAPGAEELALRQLHHVGAAYAVVFVILFVFAWRATAATRRLAERVDELERDSRRGS